MRFTYRPGPEIPMADAFSRLHMAHTPRRRITGRATCAELFQKHPHKRPDGAKHKQ